MSICEPPIEPPDDRDSCPECEDGRLSYDPNERLYECSECDYSDGYDWDAHAERLKEVREDR